MKQWNPAPRELVYELLKTRWDRKNPAPQIVVWHWAWHILDGGGAVSRRDVETYAGWTGWKAGKLLQEVKANYAEWQGYPAKPTQTNQKPTTNQPDAPVITDSCEPEPTRNQPQTNQLRARDPSYTPKPLHPTEPSTSDKDSAADLWNEINKTRKETGSARALSLTQKRRRFLTARLRKKDGRENVLRVVDWWLRSDHHRAVWVRENYGWDTVQRKFDEYLELSYEDAKRVHDHRTPKREGITEMLARRNRERDGLNVVSFPFHPSRGTTNGNK